MEGTHKNLKVVTEAFQALAEPLEFRSTSITMARPRGSRAGQVAADPQGLGEGPDGARVREAAPCDHNGKASMMLVTYPLLEDLFDREVMVERMCV